MQLFNHMRSLILYMCFIPYAYFVPYAYDTRMVHTIRERYRHTRMVRTTDMRIISISDLGYIGNACI